MAGTILQTFSAMCNNDYGVNIGQVTASYVQISVFNRKGLLTVCALYAQFSEDQNTILSPEVTFFSISAIATCNIKYQILRYFNISCSLGRNDRLSGVGV